MPEVAAMQSACGTKISPRKDQKGSSTPVNQSSQKKTGAIVSRSFEDGKEALTCVKVEGTRSKSSLKKSGTKGSIIEQQGGIQCCLRGKLNGQPVKVL